MRALTIAALVCLSSVATSAAENMPRVLIIGDQMTREPATKTIEMLKGRVDAKYVTVSAPKVLDSATFLENLDTLVGDTEWDLIHFNVGLGDLIHRAPGMKSFRVMPIAAGGVRATSPEQYRHNLQILVSKLKTKSKKLIWANTTPIRASTSGVFEKGSEDVYNKIAAEVMAEHKVPINDMNAFARSILDMNKPAGHGADPFTYDRKPAYPPYVKIILSELNLLKPAKGPVKVVIMAGGWMSVGGGILPHSEKPNPDTPRGTLSHLVLNPNTSADYKHLITADGKWATRSDVWAQSDRRFSKSGVMGVGYGGDRQQEAGSELALGHVLGNYFEEQVFIFKASIGQPSVVKDLKTSADGQMGKAYSQLTNQVHSALSALGTRFPDYDNKTGYEIVGLFLAVGEKDADSKAFESHLADLIRAIRKDLVVPQLPVAIVGSGYGGRQETKFPKIIQAQQAVAALPEFKGTVTYVETRDFWPAEDAQGAYRHPSYDQWYNNAESFYKIGEAAGKQLLKLISKE